MDMNNSFLHGSKSTGIRFFLFLVALFLIVLAAYGGTFRSPFIFDDVKSIKDNASIRQWSTALASDLHAGETASGRPILNLTFAINYKISGLDVWSYHATNLLIHFLSGLALLGIVRRTLLLPVLRERFGPPAFMLGWLVAAIWLVHPLATESVTYIVQRAESLMALFYLLTFYCFIRAVSVGQDGQNGRNIRWLGLSWLCCLAGMAAKEVMVSAPVMLVLYDAVFVSGSFRETWRWRWRWHAVYALTWIPLVLLMIHVAGRGGTVGFFAEPEITPWVYALTQCWAFVRYLWLSVIPHSLVFDYGMYVYKSLFQVWWQMLLVIAFVSASFYLYYKRPRAGWLALFYLAVLAPTTTIIPVATQVAAEHRMYLPLAAIVTAAVLLGYHFISRRILPVGLAVVAVFAVMTFVRNEVYRSEDGLWMDVVQKYPVNARAHGNVGNMFVRLGRMDEALPCLKKAIILQPTYGDHYNNLGYACAMMGDYGKAAQYYAQASERKISQTEIFSTNYCQALMKLRRFDEAMAVARNFLDINPKSAAGHVIMGNAHSAKKNFSAAEACFRKALEIDDKNAEAWNNLGNVIALHGGRLAEALDLYKKAAALAPLNADIQDNVARLLSQLGRWREAVPYFEAELAIAPDDASVRIGYADALYRLQRFAEAAKQYKISLQKDPSGQRYVGGQAAALMAKGNPEAAYPLAQAMADALPEIPAARVLLANILVAMGRAEESLPHYQEAEKAEPARVEIRYNHAVALTQCGRYTEAAEQYEEALKLAPHQAIIHHSYAFALEKLGRVQEAVSREKEALRLQPGLQEARENLSRLSP